uniref:Uncharacterized protein n=1 Tax=viral metagenome TaxID=1070528 RepID=A0A6M3M8D3_9ZZZZ
MALTEAEPSKNEGTKISITVMNDFLSIEEMRKLLKCAGEIERNKPGRVIDILFGTPDINIVARDTLSVEELKKVAQCVREIEQNKPERLINVLMYTPEKTVKEMEAVLDSVKPGMPFKTVIEFAKKDKGK